MPVAVPSPALLPGSTGTTLASLRTKLADRLNLLTQGGMTAARSDAAFTSFYDSSLVGEFENTFRNSWVVFLTGGNAGQARQVAGNKDGVLSFKRAWPNAPVVGDAYELYRRFRPTDFRTALNWAIDNVFPYIYVGFTQEVAEVATTMDYPYPSLSSPAAPTVTRVGAGAGTSYLYQLVSRNAAGDAIPSPSSVAMSNAVQLTTLLANVLTFTAVSNVGASGRYLILRSTDAGLTWQLLAALPGSAVGTVVTFTDDGSYDAAATLYAPSTSSPQLLDLRQLWRRSNPLVTSGGVTTGNTLPPAYQEMRGSLWSDLGKSVRIRWQPTTGQYILFVGYARFAPLVADTDGVDSSRLPDELLIRGGAKILYENLAAGEASSSTIYFERQAKMWSDQYEAKRREFSMEQIGREQHPPESHVVRGPNVGVGPINPYGG